MIFFIIYFRFTLKEALKYPEGPIFKSENIKNTVEIVEMFPNELNYGSRVFFNFGDFIIELIIGFEQICGNLLGPRSCGVLGEE